MAKATLKLPNGTLVTIEGTTQEIEKLLQLYAGGIGEVAPKTPTPMTKAKKDSEDLPKSGVDLMEIVNLVKTCDEAEAIEKQILDRTSEVNRVLLPLYIIHEYLKNAVGLTTTEIASVTTELGIRVSRQNTLRAIKNTGSRYVIGDKPRKIGAASHYKLNRRGVQYMKSVIAGAADEEQN